MPSLLNNLNFLGLSASAKILLTPSVGKYGKLLALADISKSVVDIGLADANVQRRLNATADGQSFLAVWPFVSAGLDIATLTSEQILGFIQTRNTAATILQQEGQLEAADRLERMEGIIEYSDELNDALKLTRSKFVKCGCGDELTDILADRIKKKLTNAEINELDEAFANVDLRNELIQDPDLVDVWKGVNHLKSLKGNAKFLQALKGVKAEFNDLIDKHIFKGDIKKTLNTDGTTTFGNAGGGHHISAVNNYTISD